MSRQESTNAIAEPPIQIRNYILDKVIGQGTYGKVRIGIDTTNNEKLLSHPHIVKVIDVIETSAFIYIIMEYAVGGELFDYIVANKRVRENEARKFFRMVLSAVDYCHQNAIIHRDLKPENLLLDEKKNIKIIDFGFGNNYNSNELLDTFCGSPFYAAPEMILGQKYTGPEVDMWSLGVILFALLCGHLPFDDDNMKELYKKISSGSYNIPSYVSAGPRHLIQRLITVDPKQRATLNEVLKHPWVNYGFEHPPFNYVPQRPVLIGPDELNEDLVRRLVIFGYSRKDINDAFAKDIDQNVPHPIRGTYFLLDEMVKRELRQRSLKLKAQQEQMKMSSDTITSESIHEPKRSQDSVTSSHTTLRMESNRTSTNKPPTTRAVSTNIPPNIGIKMQDSVVALLQEVNLTGKSPSNSATRRQSIALPLTNPNTLVKPTSTAQKIKEELLAVSGWFLNYSTTTSKSLNSVVENIQTLVENYSIVEKNEVSCTLDCELDLTIPCWANNYVPLENKKSNQIQIQISVRRVPLTNLTGLHFKRLSGGSWNYKKVCSKLLVQLNL